VLFLADRNILANQAFNAFAAFPEDALVRIDPGEIRKKGRVPKNGSVFFTIFQTFMTGSDDEGNPQPYFGAYPPDFFDLVIIDECHRGGANDESTWRGILEYFAPAVQIGLTATPKRSGNVDTYRYFGEPVYTYSLKEGDRLLKVFQDNEKTIPTILTTSRKLSTGVDARNVRNIVLLRPVKSMIEFKQIVGRGTRLYDDKDFFTIYDFVKAYEHFLDPEWDFEPLEKTRTKRSGGDDGGDEVHEDPEDEGGTEPGHDPPPPTPRPQRIRIKLADGKERKIQHMVQTSFWDPSGRPLSSKEFIERLYGDIPDLFRDEEQLREIWSTPDTRQRLLDGLADKGYTRDHLDELARIVGAEDSDVYDVLAYIAWATATMSRDERVHTHRQDIFRHYDDRQREFIEFVLDHYVQGGIDELARERLPQLLQLKYGGTYDAVDVFGDLQSVREVFVGFQRYLYTGADSA
jgi:superfamily II DNA or RNA helicase